MNEEFLINYLSKFNNKTFDELSNNNDKIRALMNITMPNDLSDEFYQKQNEYLQNAYKKIKVINVDSLLHNCNIGLFLGDITHIKADAIVNACNSQLLGCFSPLHNCIDNAIHSFAGLQVRRDLMKIMNKQNFFEKNGKCKVTKGYNLPSKYIFHTVGPMSDGIITKQMEVDLKNCYLSCLMMADQMKLKNIVFCSISTGIYGFPIEKASDIAITTVKEYLYDSNTSLKVVFDLFDKKDYDIYARKI